MAKRGLKYIENWVCLLTILTFPYFQGIALCQPQSRMIMHHVSHQPVGIIISLFRYFDASSISFSDMLSTSYPPEYPYCGSASVSNSVIPA